MAIHILYGPGGSGKSYYQARLICRELATTKRNVVTNLALNLPRLSEYLQTQYPDVTIDVASRVRLLTEEEIREFWKYRGPKRPDPADEYGTLLDNDPGALGVLYVIDEAGVAGFDAMGWATGSGGSRGMRGQECSWYLDQQRKFSDDVWASANGRSPSAIAKPFRAKAHAFVKLKNGYLASFGIFKGRGQFTARFYTVEPTGRDAEHYQEEIWTMDIKGVASVYRTQDGVGVVGVNADIGRRAKGVPVLWAIPGAIVLVGIFLWGLPKLMSKATQSSVDVAKPVSQAKAETPVAPGQPTRAHHAVGNEPATPVTVTGVVHSGRLITVLLSDGRTLTETDGTFIRLHRGGVESPKGTNYPFARIVPKPPLPPQEGLAPRSVEPEAKTSQSDYRGEALFPPSSNLWGLQPPTLPSTGRK